MGAPPDLHTLRSALLHHPDQQQLWQQLFAWIEALGGGVLLGDLDGLFDQPLATAPRAQTEPANLVLEQALEAHRAGNAQGLHQGLAALQDREPDAAWSHALHGLLAEMEGACGYAAFARALQREPLNVWFRYWLSVAALRRRDWIDFTYQALLLVDSTTLEHQLLVLAADYHLIAAALVVLTSALCRSSDLRVLDLVHPDCVAHSRDALIAHVQRNVEKERRKMIRILLTHVQQFEVESAEHCRPIHRLHELLRWRIVGLAEPVLSGDLYAALQRRIQHLSDLSRHQMI
ncbi:MAG: hypothetical protein FJ077_09755, partial [Cyanobacteria bacterium K_DeepCast_35m_m2_023]|nr:hypothetical protein [Cyanobacteria bacterium K_DeepCast_35m_m2_023]